MNLHEKLPKFVGEKFPAVVASLVAFLLLFFIIIGIKGDLRDLWVIVGIIGLLLLLLTNQRGASVFLATMVLGTLVAREEFLLEIAAMSRGTTLKEIRETRSFIPSATASSAKIAHDVKGLEAKSEQLQQRLNSPNVEDAKAAVEELKGVQKTLDITKDAARLSSAADTALRIVAEKGSLPAKDFESAMKKKGISPSAGYNDVLTQLINPGYAASRNSKTDDPLDAELILTPSGKELAQKLGLKPAEPSK